MFGTKAALRAYLEVIQPWAMGMNQRGWLASDFYTVDPYTGEQKDIEEVKRERTDPSHVIFPLNQYPITLLDRLFLGKRALAAVTALNQNIASFNAALDAVNRASDIDTRWGRIILLHAGTIGTTDGGGLHGQWHRTWRAAQ